MHFSYDFGLILSHPASWLRRWVELIVWFKKLVKKNQLSKVVDDEEERLREFYSSD